MRNEAETRSQLIRPAIKAAGWTADQIGEEKPFTAGRIMVNGRQATRGEPKRADYILRYRRDFMLAVIEAKAEDKSPDDGLQQAKEYAEILGLLFAYSTNGHGIVEFDFTTGQE